MPYKTGSWGPEAKAASKKRLEYFKAYSRMHGPPRKVFKLGRFGELLAMKKMNGAKLVNQSTHDLEWNGQKIEVKTSMIPDNHRRNPRYKFSLTTQLGKTDFFFILILDPITKELQHAYLIPDKAITSKVGIGITPGYSKYERYRLKLRPYDRK